MNWQTILSELTYRTSRSSGAGGQHVNKTETKVEVLFNVNTSEGLSEEEKLLIHSKLLARMTEEGILVMSSQKSRSQFSNKEDVTERLQHQLEKALTPKVKRKKTKPSQESVEERLAQKKLRSETKESRKKPDY
ncbi:MAG TPA: alternative ribosome rescue aminoacyl-tRNA hydrolase ArfB [Saprospiraceae bacterium]|nr:alternative ribosome rescue aminoacyl-tRNA hydrolase ArfB [Saprospiraceae bacterium]